MQAYSSCYIFARSGRRMKDTGSDAATRTSPARRVQSVTHGCADPPGGHLVPHAVAGTCKPPRMGRLSGGAAAATYGRNHEERRWHTMAKRFGRPSLQYRYEHYDPRF